MPWLPRSEPEPIVLQLVLGVVGSVFLSSSTLSSYAFPLLTGKVVWGVGIILLALGQPLLDAQGPSAVAVTL